MAIQTIAVHSVISFPAIQIPEPVTQSELALLVSLSARAKQIEKQIEDAESSIMERLQAGASVEEGEHVAGIKETSRRSVSWREVAERLAVRAFGKRKGELYCPRVLAHTEPSTSLSLVVE